MSLSKHQLHAALKRKCLSLDEKIVILDYANEYPKMGYRKMAEHFSVGKTAVLKILTDGNKVRKYHVVYEILYNWYGPCTSANVYLDEPLLQQEAMEIKRRLDKESAGFTASNGWLDSWKQPYGVREKRLCGEADEVSTTTVLVHELIPFLAPLGGQNNMDF